MDAGCCPDTGYDPDNAPLAAGCRPLLHDAWFGWADGDGEHSSAAEAARIASEGDVDRLGLIHIAPDG